MGLSEIAAAAGTTTTRQRERGVGTVDATDEPLADRLSAFAVELPTDAETAATTLAAYLDGESVEGAARAAGLAPVTGAKLLHRLGVEGLSPLGPTGRRIVSDWCAGELGRREAMTLADADAATFALAAYVETHDPIDGARAVVDGLLTAGDDRANGLGPLGRDGLGDATGDGLAGR